MRKRLNADTINVNGKTVNVGIDIHKVSWHVTVLVEGVIVESATIQPSYRVLKKLLAQYKSARIRIAYEAGFGGFNLYDDLTADGIDCIVVSPSLIPVELIGQRLLCYKESFFRLLSNPMTVGLGSFRSVQHHVHIKKSRVGI